MIYDAVALTQFTQVCAPGIATEAILPLIQVESGGDPLRINVNHGPRVKARSVPEGVGLVRRYVAQGYSVDVGLAQVNSRNFSHLGLTVESAFDPCANLQASSKVLQEGYAHASQIYGGIAAISATYSLYNTGTFERGLRNGYVGRVWQAANGLLARGQLTTSPTGPGSAAIADQTVVPAAPSPASVRKSPNADWVIGETQGDAVVVFK